MHRAKHGRQNRSIMRRLVGVLLATAPCTTARDSKATTVETFSHLADRLRSLVELAGLAASVCGVVFFEFYSTTRGFRLCARAGTGLGHEKNPINGCGDDRGNQEHTPDRGN